MVRGPIEDKTWPDTLTAHVGDPTDPSRLHGYDVWRDLAHHYGFADVVLTAQRGCVPTPTEARAFEIALTLLVPTSIAEGPAHAAALANMLAASAPGVVSTAAISLADSAQATLSCHRRWLAWLADPSGDPPDEFVARTPSDRELALSVRTLADETVCPLVHRMEPSAMATFLALLHAAGLHTDTQMIAAIVVARLPATIAEAVAHPPADRRAYPIQLPPFEYHEDEHG